MRNIEMEILISKITGARTALFREGEVAIKTSQDALDLISSAKFEAGCNSAIIEKACICNEFFDLSSGIAGEILQKFVNYGLRIAIVGDFENISSSSLRAFIIESNRQGSVLFLNSQDEAVTIISHKK